jgi:hypothetical protein
MGGDAHGHVAEADGQRTIEGPAPDPIWHRWGVLLHEAGHALFESVAHPFQPSGRTWSPSTVAALNTHAFAPFLDNPVRATFNEAFADSWSAIVLLATGAPEARQEIDRLLAFREQTRQAADHHWSRGQEDAGDGLIHTADHALRRVLAQPHLTQVAPEDALALAQHCASDGMADRWGLNGALAIAAIERSWKTLNVARAAGEIRRAQAVNLNLAQIWGDAVPTHPWVNQWTALARQAPPGVTVHADGRLEGQGDWLRAWEDLARQSAPLIERAFERQRDALTHALTPPTLALHGRRLPSLAPRRFS